MMFPKAGVFRSEKMRRAVAEIECCVDCGKFGTQAAHANIGKGRGMKTSDLCAALCPDCHTRYDQYIDMTRDESRLGLALAIIKTIEHLAINGRIKIT